MRPSSVIGAGAAALVAAASLGGCIAPDIDVVGALGVTVTAEGAPVLVVEPCDTGAVQVLLSGDRAGLADDEENPQLAEWTVDPPGVTGTSRITLGAPTAPWGGQAVTVEPDQGYVATGASSQVKGVLSQVAFTTEELAGLSPDSVYVNASSDGTGLRSISAEDFRDEICRR